MTTPCYKMIEVKELEQMATKKLIELMRDYDFNRYRDYDMDCVIGNHCACCAACHKNREMMVTRIYAILKTRPHLRNKKEAKALRQEQAAKRYKVNSTR